MNANTSTAPALNLRFDFEAIVCLEEKGFTLMKDGVKKDDFEKASTYLTFVWAGLQEEFPGITPEEVRKKIKGLKSKEIVEAVTSALVRDLGTDEKKLEATVPGTPASS